jgi:DNA-binding NarL/FixJ family response regulator
MNSQGTTEEASEHARVRVVVCDDHRLLTDALQIAIDSNPDVELAAPPVVSGEDAIKLCAGLHPDVCVMDVHLGSAMDGIEATRRLRSVAPVTKVIVLSADHAEERVLDALEAGAAGYIPKSKPLLAVVDAIMTASHGGTVVDATELPGLIERTHRSRAERANAERRLRRLTRREREILGMIRNGTSNKDIALSLYISRRTVDTHVQNALRKLECNTRLQAAAFAARHMSPRT